MLEFRRKIGRKLPIGLGWTMSRSSTSSGDVFVGKAGPALRFAAIVNQ